MYAFPPHSLITSSLEENLAGQNMGHTDSSHSAQAILVSQPPSVVSSSACHLPEPVDAAQRQNQAFQSRLTALDHFVFGWAST